jgi:hypothetical protein
MFVVALIALFPVQGDSLFGSRRRVGIVARDARERIRLLKTAAGSHLLHMANDFHDLARGPGDEIDAEVFQSLAGPKVVELSPA